MGYKAKITSEDKSFKTVKLEFELNKELLPLFSAASEIDLTKYKVNQRYIIPTVKFIGFAEHAINQLMFNQQEYKKYLLDNYDGRMECINFLNNIIQTASKIFEDLNDYKENSNIILY